MPVSAMEGRVLQRLLTSMFVVVRIVLWLSLQDDAAVPFSRATQAAMMRTAVSILNPVRRQRKQLDERSGGGSETTLMYAFLLRATPSACCLPMSPHVSLAP